jgi:glutamine amidotransferase
LATIGNVEQENCHPFTAVDKSGRTWTLIHNGTVFESDKLNKYIFLQKGETDSERILLYLTDRINEAVRKSDAARKSEAARKSGAARISDRIQTVEDVIREITPGNKVNLLMSDGSLLYVHVNCERGMYYLDDGDSAVFSTKPLLAAGDNEADRMASEVWKEVPLNTLMVYSSGQMIYRGCPHGNTFVETEEKMRYLFMDYSEI